MAHTLPERCLSEADRVHILIERLYDLLPIAGDERRRSEDSHRLLDGYTDLGRTLTRMGRG